ncbi:MAG: flagellar filament capping protein FliD [Deltaproteobacteria bacterium]|nr:flagellar filament capping protein FliD [Deltaproteobacteria bacterium]
MGEGTFRAGGLASGLDTNLIVDQLTDLQRQPIRSLERKQEAFRIQLSGIASLKSGLESLKKAASSMSDEGVLGVTASSNSGFTATASPYSFAGSYSVRVDALAQTAKERTTAFASAAGEVTEGTLSLNIHGTDYDFSMAAGGTLADVVFAINQSSAPVSATILNDGTNSYLSITNTETGHEIGQPASSALTITENYTGGSGQTLGFASVQAASNALFNVDGVDFERTTNTISDVVPGTDIVLKNVTTVAEDLLQTIDLDKTEENLKTFVNAYNAMMSLIQGDLDVKDDADRAKSLAGDSSVKILQRSLQRMLTTEVTDAGTSVRTLSDIGITTERDGSLLFSRDKMEKAITRDAAALGTIFSGSNGISTQMVSLVDIQTDAEDGILTTRSEGLQESIDRIDLEVDQMEIRVENFRNALIAKFVAMENIVSGTQVSANFLSQVKFPGFTTES